MTPNQARMYAAVLCRVVDYHRMVSLPSSREDRATAELRVAEALEQIPAPAKATK